MDGWFVNSSIKRKGCFSGHPNPNFKKNNKKVIIYYELQIYV